MCSTSKGYLDRDNGQYKQTIVVHVIYAYFITSPEKRLFRVRDHVRRTRQLAEHKTRARISISVETTSSTGIAFRTSIERYFSSYRKITSSYRLHDAYGIGLLHTFAALLIKFLILPLLPFELKRCSQNTVRPAHKMRVMLRSSSINQLAVRPLTLQRSTYLL